MKAWFFYAHSRRWKSKVKTFWYVCRKFFQHIDNIRRFIQTNILRTPKHLMSNLNSTTLVNFQQLIIVVTAFRVKDDPAVSVFVRRLKSFSFGDRNSVPKSVCGSVAYCLSLRSRLVQGVSRFADFRFMAKFTIR